MKARIIGLGLFKITSVSPSGLLDTTYVNYPVSKDETLRRLVYDTNNHTTKKYQIADRIMAARIRRTKADTIYGNILCVEKVESKTKWINKRAARLVEEKYL